MDPELARVILGLFSVVNTAILVYQAVKLQSVHKAVNGARDEAVKSSELSGFLLGVEASTPRVGKTPTGTPPTP